MTLSGDNSFKRYIMKKKKMKKICKYILSLVNMTLKGLVT